MSSSSFNCTCIRCGAFSTHDAAACYAISTVGHIAIPDFTDSGSEAASATSAVDYLGSDDGNLPVEYTHTMEEELDYDEMVHAAAGADDARRLDAHARHISRIQSLAPTARQLWFPSDVLLAPSAYMCTPPARTSRPAPEMECGTCYGDTCNREVWDRRRECNACDRLRSIRDSGVSLYEASYERDIAQRRLESRRAAMKKLGAH